MTTGNMKRYAFLLALLLLGLTSFSQEVAEQSIVVNVEVPVRVFDANGFVENLGLDDFELYEDNVRQKVEAVYLIKKRTIERSDEKKRFMPKTARNFYVIFEVTEFTPRMSEAIIYFIREVLVSGDNLTIVTPLKTYRLRAQTFKVLTKDEVAKQLIGILRKDTLIGNSDYANAVNDLTALTRSLTSLIQGDGEQPERQVNSPDSLGTGLYKDMPLDLQLSTYAAMLSKLENLRRIDQDKLLSFAKVLKDKEGQKSVFLLYQREFIPQIDPRILNQYLSLYEDRPDIMQSVTTIFDFHKRDITIDVDLIKQTYSDSSISIHMILIASPTPNIPGVRMEEHTEDIFSTFSEMALATGGFVESSANPSASFRKAVEASENYYLLYYLPQRFVSDGKFCKIEVQVKNRPFKVTHRSGYFRN
jgi:VWFA-related protein